MMKSMRVLGRVASKATGVRAFSAAGAFPQPLTEFTEEEKMLKDAGEYVDGEYTSARVGRTTTKWGSFAIDFCRGSPGPGCLAT
jgi:hypothetical protein